MAQIPTRTVRVKATGKNANINVGDFDPKLHEELGPPKPTAPVAAPKVATPTPTPTPTATPQKKNATKG